jgi:hypothetical protein
LTKLVVFFYSESDLLNFVALANEERREKYLTELRSGNHHENLSDNHGKHEMNRVFISAALEAGFSESSAKNHRQKIDEPIGFEKVKSAYEEGYLVSLREKRSPEKIRVKEAEPEVLPGMKLEIGNPAHIGIAKIAGKIGNKGIKFLELSAEAASKGLKPSDYQLMIQAGFTPAQARNPKRLRELLGSVGGEHIMEALAMMGVDSVMIAERLAHLMNRKKMVPVLVKNDEGKDEVMMDQFGNVVLQETEFYDQSCVDMALKHFQNFMGKTAGGASTNGEMKERLSDEERERLDRQMAKRGLISGVSG